LVVEEFIKQAGTLVAVFFLISLAVETILESFRGLLAMVGIEVLKSKKSLDEAMDEVAEFLPPDRKDVARFEALISIVENSAQSASTLSTKIGAIRRDLAAAVDPSGKLKIIDREKEWLAAMSDPIRKVMEAKESNRVFALRIISAVLGVGVAYAAQIDVTMIVAAMHPDTTQTAVEAAANSVTTSWIGYIIAGLAAAGGSSFWHDQLDRVRSLKQAGESVASLTATVRKP
jgi:hypothetical protein